MCFMTGAVSFLGGGIGLLLIKIGDVSVGHFSLMSLVTCFGNCFHLLLASAVVTAFFLRYWCDLALAWARRWAFFWRVVVVVVVIVELVDDVGLFDPVDDMVKFLDGDRIVVEEIFVRPPPTRNFRGRPI